MVSRRDFITASLAVSAGSAIGCGGNRGEQPGAQPAAAPAPAKPVAKPSLTIFFVGGTLFRRMSDGVGMLAAQMSGYNQAGQEIKDPDGNTMLHESFLVVAYRSGLEGTRFTSYPTHRLHGALVPGHDFKYYCLKEHDVIVESSDTSKVTNSCNRTVKYEAKAWKPHGDWEKRDKPRTAALSSRFFLTGGGELTDSGEVNQTGARSRWHVQGKLTYLSDVAMYRLEADTITLKISGESDYPVPASEPLTLFVFSGPVHVHAAGRYEFVNHALLLKNLYNDITGEIRPKSERKLPRDEGLPSPPCSRGYMPDQAPPLAPPDSEYCPNYEDCFPCP